MWETLALAPILQDTLMRYRTWGILVSTSNTSRSDRMYSIMDAKIDMLTPVRDFTTAVLWEANIFRYK